LTPLLIQGLQERLQMVAPKTVRGIGGESQISACQIAFGVLF